MKPPKPGPSLPPQSPRTRAPSAAPGAPPPNPRQTAAPPPPSSSTPPSLEDTLPPAAPASPPRPSESDWLAKAKAHFEKRDFQEALAAFSKALTINPNSAGAYFGRGVVYKKLGANQRAVADLKSAARLDHKKARDFLTSNNISW